MAIIMMVRTRGRNHATMWKYAVLSSINIVLTIEAAGVNPVDGHNMMVRTRGRNHATLWK